MVQEIEDFYGVFLQLSLNPKYKGYIDIGYTVDPNRRIKQHNTGAHAGGAYQTSGKGPWEMVLIVHGFPNEICRQQFKKAWQNPHTSRRLRHVSGKLRSETAFQFKWRIVCNMLNTAPWSGLALNVRWLKQQYRLDFPTGLDRPLHMPVVFGPVVSKSVAGSQKGTSRVTPSASSSTSVYTNALPMSGSPIDCDVCSLSLMEESSRVLRCLRPSCGMKAHMTCLAKLFLDNPSQLLPVEGPCPSCGETLLWGELIRWLKGCHRNLSAEDERIPSVQESDEDI